MPTATAITPSTVVTTVSWVGALGFARSRSQAAPVESTMRTATTRGSRQIIRERIVASSKGQNDAGGDAARDRRVREVHPARSEEHTSELQSLTNLVCRLLLEKKKKST